MKRIIPLVVLLLFGCGRTELDHSTNRDLQNNFPSLDLHGVLLPAPVLEAETAYLGLGPLRESFSLDRVKTELIVIEIFNMYCVHCQREAETVNRCIGLIARAGLDGKVKFIGVGRTNTPLEVETFRKKYDVPFPLFPDTDRAISERFGAQKAATPHFIFLKRSGEGALAEVIFEKTGRFKGPQSFFDEIVKRGNLR